MLNIFIAVFFATLSFSFIEPFFFIGYLMSIATSVCTSYLHGQRGRAWDQAKKIVELS